MKILQGFLFFIFADFQRITNYCKIFLCCVLVIINYSYIFALPIARKKLLAHSQKGLHEGFGWRVGVEVERVL